MKIITYKCTLLANVVITSKGATQGNHRSLDYIPGSKFLGLVASKHYDMSNAKQTLDLFHNGTVRFGDAHPYINKERLACMPMSWQMIKGEEDGTNIYLHHELTRPIKERLKEQGKQLKQVKANYFSTSDNQLKIQQHFSMKSAYDVKERRSAEGQMFGYSALEKGTAWCFTVELDNPNSIYTNLLNTSLIGRHQLGRSKSAEYGWVKIEEVLDPVPIASKTVPAGIVYLYAASNLCFYDKQGNNTGKPTAKQLNIPNATILWKESRIRTRQYRTWNRKRRNRDADRLIIQKGSVFAVKTEETIDSKIFDKRVGQHLSEGFGKIDLHPNFLLSETEKLDKSLDNYEQKFLTKESAPVVNSADEDDRIINFLLSKSKAAGDKNTIATIINTFIAQQGSEFSNISSSQWGQIRKYAKYSANAETLKILLFDEKIGFCYRGQSERNWRQKGRRTNLENLLFENKDKTIKGEKIIELTSKLAAEMAKV